MANQWFRLYAEFAHDPKVQMLSEVNQRRLIMLFCFRCNGDVTLQDEEVTFQLRISEEEWQKTKAIFIAKGFINSDNKVLNWDKRQFISDSSSERVAKHREKKKQEGNVTVTPQNRTDTEQNRAEQKKHSAGEVCLEIKKNGIIDVSPSHPTLLKLIEAGATIDNFVDAAKVCNVKKFAYLLKVIETQLKNASELDIKSATINKAKSYKNDTMVAAQSIFTNSSGIPYYQAKEIEVKND